MYTVAVVDNFPPVVGGNKGGQRVATDAEIEAAVAMLRAGGLVGFPTETVYGLGADATNPDALRRLFAAKGRPADHPVIVHMADIVQLPEWAREIPRAALQLADAFWPGPLTLILPRAAHVSDLVTGGQDSVGVRVPRHPVAQQLLRAFGGGVAAPSANRFGHISPTRAAHVRAEFDTATVPVVLDGDPPDIGVESTIVDMTGDRPTLLRPGGITPAQLAAILGASLAAPGAASPRAPGTLRSHYAPATPLEIVPSGEIAARAIRLQRQGLSVAALLHTVEPSALTDGVPQAQQRLRWSGSPPDAAYYARRLYERLRVLDRSQSSRILVEAVPTGDEWLAVRDRLRRAATKPNER